MQIVAYSAFLLKCTRNVGRNKGTGTRRRFCSFHECGTTEPSPTFRSYLVSTLYHFSIIITSLYDSVFRTVDPFLVEAKALNAKSDRSVGLRVKPNKTSSAIRRLMAGDQLQVIAQGPTWSKVVDMQTGKPVMLPTTTCRQSDNETTCMAVGSPTRIPSSVADLPVFARANPGKTNDPVSLADRDNIKQNHGFILPVPLPVCHARCTI